MDFTALQSTINDGLMVAGSVILVLVALFFVSRRWFPLRIVGLLLLVIATQTAPDQVVWWATGALAAGTVAAAIFIVHKVFQITVDDVTSATKPLSRGDIPGKATETLSALKSRNVRGTFTAVKELLTAVGIRRIHIHLLLILLAAVIVAATFQLALFAFAALTISTLLVGGGLLVLRATTAAEDAEDDTIVGEFVEPESDSPTPTEPAQESVPELTN